MIQNKMFIVILVLVLVGGGIFIFKWSSKESILPLPSEVPAKSNLKKILDAPRLKPEEKVVSSVPETVSQECLDFWTEIQRLDLDDFIYPPRLRKLPDSKGCVAVPASFGELQKDYAEHCGALMTSIDIPSTSEEWEKQAANCMVALYFLRSGISTWQHRDENLSEISDLPLLVDKLAMEFSKLLKGNRDTSQLISVAERILQVDPYVYGAAKTVLIGHILNMVSTKGYRKKEDAYWAQMEELLQRAMNLNPNDPELSEMARVIRTRGFDPNRIKRKAEQMIAHAPQSSEGYHYLGYAYWKLGNRQASFQALEKALRLDPSNPILLETWEAIHKPDANVDAYGINIKLGINFTSILK